MDIPLGDQLDIRVRCKKTLRRGSSSATALEGKEYKVIRKTIFIHDPVFHSEGETAIFFVGEDGREHYLIEESEIYGFWTFFEMWSESNIDNYSVEKENMRHLMLDHKYKQPKKSLKK